MSENLKATTAPGPTVAPPPGGKADPARPRGTTRKVLRNPLGGASAALLLLIVLAVVLAPLIAPQGPGASVLADAFAGPSAGHPLGMDSAGRDILSRVLYGGATPSAGPCSPSPSP